LDYKDLELNFAAKVVEKKEGAGNNNMLLLMIDFQIFRKTSKDYGPILGSKDFPSYM
jgi:hypothetical protein